ncbi:MAG: HypC/HybG/HupF family hydrogenase formation chaperone [Verrucomicrobiota bacterium]
MCLAVPAKVRERRGDAAVVEMGGVLREVSLVLVDDVSVGEWVIIHAGFAIEKLSEEEAEQTLALFRQTGDAPEVH